MCGLVVSSVITDVLSLISVCVKQEQCLVYVFRLIEEFMELEQHDSG